MTKETGQPKVNSNRRIRNPDDPQIDGMIDSLTGLTWLRKA
jgi:hypothetical protein